MRYTIAELAEKLGTEKECARGLVRYLLAEDLAHEMGVRHSAGGGRGENLYSFADGFENVLAMRLRRAKLV